ncbi:MAG: TetR/AcrR family transcriptional regulator [Acidiferrobacterales bacterium]|nr:TetR/AcrR family transcriptional regulator [Acidiferrobacterales bacterium]
MSKNEPESSRRVQVKRERMRREVLAAAKALLMADGPDAVTLSAVTDRLGMTKPAIYHYFPSKEALTRSLVASLIDEEISQLESAVEKAGPGDNLIGTMIRAFHSHYRTNMHAFRFVYGQLQLYLKPGLVIDADMVRSEITPRTRHFFDLMESRLASADQGSDERRHMRRLAFAAWMSALGLLTMIAIAEGMDDPLLYSDEELLDTIVSVFEHP